MCWRGVAAAMARRVDSVMPRASTAVAFASAGFDSMAASVFEALAFEAGFEVTFGDDFDSGFGSGFGSALEAAFAPDFAATSARVGTLGRRDDVRAETSRTTASSAPLFTPFAPAPVAFSTFGVDLETPLETLFEPATEPLTLRDEPRAGVSFAIDRTG